MRKSDGTYTYFVPDVAYHLDKWERGFAKAINVQGSDHHGTIARVRAGLQAADEGVPQGWPDYLLHKMITVMRGGEEVKISKRAGSYVTLRDLIDWTSRDAVRFFLVSRKADTEFVFDIDLALKQNDENPVFYVQYAHARICSVLRQFADKGGDLSQVAQRRPVAADRAVGSRADAQARRVPRDAGRRRARPRAARHRLLRAQRGRELPLVLRRRALPGRRRRARAGAPGAADGHGPGAAQRAGRARRQRARSHEPRRTRRARPADS